jgi:hypothetical protein
MIQEFLIGHPLGTDLSAAWRPFYSLTSSLRPATLRRAAAARSANCWTDTTCSSDSKLNLFRGREVTTVGDGFLATLMARRKRSCAPGGEAGLHARQSGLAGHRTHR